MWGLSYCSKFGVGPNYTIVVVGWGTKSLFKKGATTDQLKTVVPKVPDLANTALFKGKGRIVTGLVGVLMPCLFSRPIMYTVLENMPAGGNMQASILLGSQKDSGTFASQSRGHRELHWPALKI